MGQQLSPRLNTPDTVDAMVHESLQIARAGRIGEALTIVEDAARSAPGHFGALHLTGYLHHEMGDALAALEWLQRAIEMQPLNTDVLSHLGGVYTDLQRFDVAECCLLDALEIDANHPDALLRLGEVYRRSGRIGEAANVFLRAIKANPMNSDAFVGMASVVYEHDNPALAIEALEGALNVQPGHPEALFHLATIAHHLGDSEGSEALLAAGSIPIAWTTSWEHVGLRQGAAPGFGTRWGLFEAAMDACMIDGPILEAGLEHAHNIRFALARWDGPIHGFGPFEHEIPMTARNVVLHRGSLEEKLAVFADGCEKPIRLLHVDATTYEDTRTVFEHLAHLIEPGTVIVFDDFLMTEEWHEEGFQAFQEAVWTHGWTWEYVGYCLYTGQAALRIGSKR